MSHRVVQRLMVVATFNSRRHGLSSGFRSGLEEVNAAHLKSLRAPFRYEEVKLPYTPKESKYTPDFILDNGIVVETKGYFTGEDRTKHLLIQAQHPKLDLRFVFQNPNNKLSKTSKTTYGSWCTKHGFQFASKLIPTSWTKEKGPKWLPKN